MDKDEKIEKKKLLGSIYFEYDARSLTKELLISVLSLPFDKRTLSNKAMLSFYCLNVSKLPQKFIKEHIDKASYNNIINLSTPSFSYKLILNKDTLVYEVSDIAQYFYIILDGSAKIIKAEKYAKDMNANDYYILLMKYKKQNELCLLEKTIKENYHIFPVDKKDLDNLESIYLKVLLIRYEQKYSEEPIENVISKAGLKLSDFGLLSYEEEIAIENNKINEENNLLISQKKGNQIKGMIQYNYDKHREKNRYNINKIKAKLKNISLDLTMHYSFLANEGKSPIIYFKFIDYKDITVNDYFGDFDNDKYLHRVISTSDELELLLIRNDIYIEFMKNEKAIIKSEQINFLTQNFFFSSIGKFVFEKLYYDLFDFETYKMNEEITKENSKVEYIYFIKSGKVDLISYKSIIENHLIINIIYEILKKQNKKFKKGSINDKYLKLYSSSYIQNFEKIKKEIKSPQKNNLMIYKENQCIGHECFYYGFNYLYTAIAKSEMVEVYKIGVDKLMKIIKDKSSINNVHSEFVKKSFESLLLFFKLIININTSWLKYYHNNKSKPDNVFEEEVEEKIIKKDDNEKDNDNDINNDKKNENINEKKVNTSRNFNSEINNYNFNNNNNIERKTITLRESQFTKYKAFPLFSKSVNFKNISFNNEEKDDKNMTPNKIKNLEKLPLSKIKNKSLFSSNSYRSNNSSNNLSNINIKDQSKNFNLSSTFICNNNIKKNKTTNNIFENSLLQKIRKINTINIFNLRKSFYTPKNIDINTDSNNSTNIITFDYPLLKRYKFPYQMNNNNDSKYGTIDCMKSLISLKKDKNRKEFNNYYKFYSSEFYSNKDFIKNHFKYNYKHSILTNKKLIKYGVFDIIRPKIRKNISLNFKLVDNLENKKSSFYKDS